MHNPSRSVFDTGGAKQLEGRWHSAGTPLIYTAEHISLAALETLIHAGGRRLPPRVVTSLFIPDDLQPENAVWMDLPRSQRFGDLWVQQRRSALLRGPSIAASKMEFNCLINPAHSDFKKIIERESSPFVFDERFIHFR